MSVRDESGQVLPLVTVMMLGLLAMVGLVVDGGLLFAARRDLQATADAATRGGAAIMDEKVYRQSGGQRAELDPEGAESAALRRLGGVEVVSIRASSDAVFIRIARSQPLLLLGLIGVGAVRVEAYSTARPRTGILAPGG
jgi:hypothetical protein